MYLKLSRKALAIPRLVLLTMLVQKYGRINLMIQKVTFGPLAAFSMRCVLWSHRSEQTICKVYTRKLLKENIHEFQNILVKKWPQ